jgi:feruloyl esterase
MRITPLFLALFLTLLWLPGHINASTEEACLEFTDIKHNHDLVITSSTWQSAGTINRNGNDVEVPEHCLVMAYINKRVSEYDKQEYAIGFEMRLPRGWNQRFLFQGNGGNDGVIVPAIGFKALHGKYTPSALQRGFAILSSDAGHTDDRSSLISGNLFAHDPQARLDYGYQANQKLVPIARQIMNQYYGTHPHHSYFMGCSNGGRHAMVAASRLASHFDGFVAGNPGFNLPKAGVTHAWDIQALLELDNDLSQSLTRDEMSLVAKQVVNVCDALDGLEDGMVNNLATCQEQFKLHTLQCSNDDSTT